MAATAITIQIGQVARAVLTPSAAGATVPWYGGAPTWSANNGNVSVTPDSGSNGLQADIQGLAAGTSVVTATGQYAGTGGNLTGTFNVTVVAAPTPNDFAVAASAKPFPR